MAVEWFTVDETARRSGFSQKTIYRAVQAGELESRKIRCRWRISAEAFERWMGSGLVAESQEPRRPRRATSTSGAASVARLVAIEREQR